MSELKQDAEAACGRSDSTEVLGVVDKETAILYAGKCCFCKFFRDAYTRTTKAQGHWVDNPGWCVRYPPVFIGGVRDNDEDVDFGRFEQPGVEGGDECGEFLQAEAPNVQIDGLAATERERSPESSKNRRP